MTDAPDVPLILGGHSFISQLGNDPAVPPDGQVELVRTCLDNGIRWFDTTYQPERIALGQALGRLGRRAEAMIFAWNFFVDFQPGQDVGGPAYYQPHHIELMLEQLQTDCIDCLVVHAMDSPAENHRQEELAVLWQQKGYVRRLGVWHPGADAAKTFGAGSPYSFMVRPNNITTADAAPAFAACRQIGWQNFACSPFGRGWELDKLVAAAQRTQPGDELAARDWLAELMLRYSLFQPNVDRLIVAMRRTDWVARNVASVAKGPLSAEEMQWLTSLRA